MSEFKYLSDGKKVSVIGKINKTEYIVQEIFVTANGDEIPSGENFTAKSLHDNPVISWKEKEVEKYNKLYEKKKESLSNIEKNIRILENRCKAHSALLKANEKFIELFNNSDTELMADILTGNVKYVVCTDSYYLKVQEFNDVIFKYDNYWGDKRFEGIKMMSVLGIDGYGKTKIRINEYSDGSGCDKSYEFFRDEEQLRNYLEIKVKELIEENKLTLSVIKDIKPYYEVDKNIVDKLKEEQQKILQAQYEKSVGNAKDNLEKQLASLG